MQKGYYRVLSGQCHRDKSRAHIFTQNRGRLSGAWVYRMKKTLQLETRVSSCHPLVFKSLKAPAPATWVRTEVQVGWRAVVETRKAQGGKKPVSWGAAWIQSRKLEWDESHGVLLFSGVSVLRNQQRGVAEEETKARQFDIIEGLGTVDSGEWNH